MALTEGQKEYIIQNFTHTDEQLASFLKVDIKEIEEYTKTIGDLMLSMKEMAKTKRNPSILIDLISEIDVLMLITIPTLVDSKQKENVINSLKNLIRAGENGQFANLVIEGLRRSKELNSDYMEVYNIMKEYLTEVRDQTDIISPYNPL